MPRDITYRDKTSGGKKSGETKYPEGQNVRQKKNLWGQNIQIHNICGTKRPWDKMSVWTKHPET
jgi:hypothetical protein